MKLKEPKTFEEQLSILESRGIIVNDSDACLDFLRKVNYYRFTAYLLTFRKEDGEHYRSVPFETPYIQIMTVLLSWQPKLSKQRMVFIV